VTGQTRPSISPCGPIAGDAGPRSFPARRPFRRSSHASHASSRPGCSRTCWTVEPRWSTHNRVSACREPRPPPCSSGIEVTIPRLFRAQTEPLGMLVFGMITEPGAPRCSPPGQAGLRGRWHLYRRHITGGEGRGSVTVSPPEPLRYRGLCPQAGTVAPPGLTTSGAWDRRSRVEAAPETLAAPGTAL
jgi:hypothetical protein